MTFVTMPALDVAIPPAINTALADRGLRCTRILLNPFSSRWASAGFTIRLEHLEHPGGLGVEASATTLIAAIGTGIRLFDEHVRARLEERA